jgi:hypothetical protein
MSMADVILIFISMVVIIIGAVPIAFMSRAAHRRRERERRDQPQLARKRLAALDDYLQRVSQATTEDELDSLESEKSQRKEKE